MKKIEGESGLEFQEKLDSLCLCEKERQIIQNLFKQKQQARRHCFASAFTFFAGLLAFGVSIKIGTEDYIWAMLVCIMSISYFLNIRRDAKLAEILRRLSENPWQVGHER